MSFVNSVWARVISFRWGVMGCWDEGGETGRVRKPFGWWGEILKTRG